MGDALGPGIQYFEDWDSERPVVDKTLRVVFNWPDLQGNIRPFIYRDPKGPWIFACHWVLQPVVIWGPLGSRTTPLPKPPKQIILGVEQSISGVNPEQ
jgi:hypothetical protein